LVCTQLHVHFNIQAGKKYTAKWLIVNSVFIKENDKIRIDKKDKMTVIYRPFSLSHSRERVSKVGIVKSHITSPLFPILSHC